jgi:hypothetical protein
MLFGKVTDYNVRSNLRATSPPSKNQDPFQLPGFELLDKLVCNDFLESIPQEYKHNFGIGDVGTGVDTDLYMVHLIPHACVSYSEVGAIRVLIILPIVLRSHCTILTWTSLISNQHQLLAVFMLPGPFFQRTIFYLQRR